MAAFYDFCYLWLSNTVVVSGVVNLISLWYSLMYRDLYDVWFLGSWWLTRDVRGNVCSINYRLSRAQR